MIPREKILLRRSLISQTLVDEIYSGVNDQILLQLQEIYKFSDDVLFAIEKKCQYVLLGFLRTKDLFEELVQEVKLDSKTALAVYQTLDEKIFSRLRSDIENTYKLFQVESVVPDTLVSPIQTKEQVVLRKESSPETITLSFKDTPPQASINQMTSINNISQVRNTTPSPQITQPNSQTVNIPAFSAISTPPPVSLGESVQGNLSPSQMRVTPVSSQNQIIAPSKVIPASLPSQNTNTSATKAGPTSILNSGQQTVSPSMFAIPNTQSTAEGPMVLHKKEEVSSVGQSTAGRTYRQMSFGSFMGAFKTPQNKETNISRAEIEIPNMTQSNNNSPSAPSQQVPFSVKKYETSSFPQQKEQAKVVHYTFEDTSSHTDPISPTPNPK